MARTADELIGGLMRLSEVGTVNHREDTRLIRDAENQAYTLAKK